MVKLFYNLAFVLCFALGVLAQAEDINKPDLAPIDQDLKVVQPENIKIFMESHVERVDSSKIDPNQQVLEAKPAVDQPAVDKTVEQINEPSQSINLLNILSMNPLSRLFENENQVQQTDDSEQPMYHRRLFIFRIFPNLGNDDDTKVETKPLLGGGGENDPDIIRFKLDDDTRNMMTGQDHHMISNSVSMHSMMEHIKNMLGFMDTNESEEDEDSTKHLPFVIRTEDGNEAIIPNEIGDETRLKENKNCMMLSFMRLKASIYYRTLLHLLFFTGILLFILSMIMITFKTFRKKRYSTLRYTPHSMDVSSIDGDLVKDKSIKSWYGITSDRSTIVSDNNKIVLIQAPPAYDQVIVGDSTKLLDDDAKCDTKSLPPSYDLVNEKN